VSFSEDVVSAFSEDVVSAFRRTKT